MTTKERLKVNIKDSSVICAIGEYAVLAELLRYGFNAYLAHGPKQKGWDIVVIDDNLGLVTKIQVKTIS